VGIIYHHKQEYDCNMPGKGALIIAAIIIAIAIAIGLYASGRDGQLMNRIEEQGRGENGNSNMVQVIIKSDSRWSANIKDSQSESHIIEGSGDRTIPITCGSEGSYSLTVQKSAGGSETLNVEVVTEGGRSSQRSATTSSNGIVSLAGTC
jgi:hypothetical protein